MRTNSRDRLRGLTPSQRGLVGCKLSLLLLGVHVEQRLQCGKVREHIDAGLGSFMTCGQVDKDPPLTLLIVSSAIDRINIDRIDAEALGEGHEAERVRDRLGGFLSHFYLKVLYCGGLRRELISGKPIAGLGLACQTPRVVAPRSCTRRLASPSPNS